MGPKPERIPRRHHFIPRLLLKGFASRIAGEKFFVYQFRRASGPIEVSVADVGVEKYFHGRTADIEERLQAKESEYGPLVWGVREGYLDPASFDLVVDFVLNLITRTKNVRVGFAEMGTAIFERFDAEVQNPRNYGPIKELIREELLSQKKLRKKIRKRFGTLPRDQVERLVKQGISSLPFDPVLVFQHLIREARARVDLGAAARDAQLRVLQSDAGLALRRKELRRFRWSLKEQPRGTFILGDLGPVARLHEFPDVQNPVRPGTTMAIYLPVSSRFLLIGRREGDHEEVDPEAINLAAVELSRDVFVADRNTRREEDYLKVLGQRAQLFDHAELDEGIRGIFD